MDLDSLKAISRSHPSPITRTGTGMAIQRNLGQGQTHNNKTKARTFPRGFSRKGLHFSLETTWGTFSFLWMWTRQYSALKATCSHLVATRGNACVGRQRPEEKPAGSWGERQAAGESLARGLVFLHFSDVWTDNFPLVFNACWVVFSVTV